MNLFKNLMKADKEYVVTFRYEGTHHTITISAKDRVDAEKTFNTKFPQYTFMWAEEK
ncbi:hypothetical protein [Ralstonia phage RSP15]|uniref:hypothetical protein n=1 Tax=Ralstonia phage RSP15 TaxID=1785960 RepID=UPI00074D485F|nr:hypothetical protein BH754_gp129 [Ralstonia phage RSP15]BAU40177.1 hypothetical protein [Ralstonia phage RSP15]